MYVAATTHLRTCSPIQAALSSDSFITLEYNECSARGPAWRPRRVLPSRTSGDFFPAARSPAIWWKWLQNSMAAVVRPTTTDAAAAQWLTSACPGVLPATCISAMARGPVRERGGGKDQLKQYGRSLERAGSRVPDRMHWSRGDQKPQT